MPKLPFHQNTPWLAPLAGYSDLPFRLLCRELGAACCTTEMISAKGLFYKSPGTRRLLLTTAADTPLIVQLFGAEDCFLRFAVKTLKELGFRFFDLNIGCAVPKVVRQRAGAGMLLEPENILTCAKAMIEEAGEGMVGFKFRLGFDAEHVLVPELPKLLESLGAGWITLHPRTAKQGFRGTADWSYTKELAQTLSIPTVASGDLLTAKDGLRCLQETGAATVMYARGALARPTIFADHQKYLAGTQVEDPTYDEMRAILCRHIELAKTWSNGTNPIARMRGILSAYAKGLPNTRALRIALCQCTSWDDFSNVIARWPDTT